MARYRSFFKPSRCFVYSKYFGDAFNGSDHFPDGWGMCLYTVRLRHMELIGGSKLEGRLDGKRFRSFETHPSLGAHFDAWSLEQMCKLRDAIYDDEALAKLEPHIWHVGGALYGIIAFKEEDAVAAAYKARFRAREVMTDKDRPWLGLLAYQE